MLIYFNVMIEKKKTLSFQKETISNLSSNEMKNVKGGWTYSSYICQTAASYLATLVVEKVREHYSEFCTQIHTTGGMS